ncbi:MAG: hypothetical protein V3V81_07570 [Candidatus Bathyarchaeia archaeon]
MPEETELERGILNTMAAIEERAKRSLKEATEDQKRGVSLGDTILIESANLVYCLVAKSKAAAKREKELSARLRERGERMELAQSMIAVGVYGEAVAMLDKDFKDYEHLEVCMKAKRKMEATLSSHKEGDTGD